MIFTTKGGQCKLPLCLRCPFCSPIHQTKHIPVYDDIICRVRLNSVKWSRRESNPRPKYLPSSFYKLSHSFLIPQTVPRMTGWQPRYLLIRPYAKSITYVVSCIVDARFISAGAYRRTAALRQRMLNYLQRLILIVRFNASSCGLLLRLLIPCRNLYYPKIINI